MLKRLIFVLLISAGALHAAHADTWLSWSEFDQNGENIQIYLSRETGDKTGPVQKITHRGMNITPSLLAAQDELWIAWVDRGNRLDYRLRYARIDSNTQNMLESGTIATSDRRVYAPVFAMTATGSPVLAWSGLDGKDEEIRLAYFQKGRWGSEKKVTQNDVPDTLPIFSSGAQGELVLSWEQLSDTEIFVRSLVLQSDYVSARSEDPAMNGSSDADITSNRRATRNSASIQRLPGSLQARQSQFLMGSRTTVSQ